MHPPPLTRILAIFIAVFVLLQWGYQSARGTAFERVVIDTATVKPSAWLINLVTAQERVQARGAQLISSHVRLSVLNGCEGTESLFLIVAAIMAYRSAWRHKLVGLVAGIGLIYMVNQLRIVSLYFALRYDRDLFAALHGIVGPTLIIVIGCLFYLWWIRWPHRVIQAT